MNSQLYQNHLAVLREELLIALGCTEPIAVAFVGAKAQQLLGEQAENCLVRCSGNVIKNVKAVTVPNSGGARGIEMAAALGIVGGDCTQNLSVLEAVTPGDIETARHLVETGFCRCELAENVNNLYIHVQVNGRDHSVVVEMSGHHNNIIYMEKDGVALLDHRNAQTAGKCESGNRYLLDIKNILEFADQVEIKDVEDLLSQQITLNFAIAQEGLLGNFGANVGRCLMEQCGGVRNDGYIRWYARAMAAAGSDARMGGCPLPVVINSGSGNQGITASVPIIVYGRAWEIPRELIYRALIVSNLISVHQKKYIGTLSAYCGATSAATGAACGIAYMKLMQNRQADRIYQVICDTITNSIGTLSGMVCDGAKSSCAAKIGVAVENALMALDLSLAGSVFRPGEGLTMKCTEDTIAAVGRLGRVGMKSTDVEVLNIMLENEYGTTNERESINPNIKLRNTAI